MPAIHEPDARASSTVFWRYSFGECWPPSQNSFRRAPTRPSMAFSRTFSLNALYGKQNVVEAFPMFARIASSFFLICSASSSSDSMVRYGWLQLWFDISCPLSDISFASAHVKWVVSICASAGIHAPHIQNVPLNPLFSSSGATIV